MYVCKLAARLMHAAAFLVRIDHETGFVNPHDDGMSIDLRDSMAALDEARRVFALAEVAMEAFDAGVLVDLISAVERGASPDELLNASLDEAASPWRAWTKKPSASNDSSSEAA